MAVLIVSLCFCCFFNMVLLGFTLPTLMHSLFLYAAIIWCHRQDQLKAIPVYFSLLWVSATVHLTMS